MADESIYGQNSRKSRKRKASGSHMTHVYNQIYATIYGQCIGDAMGLLTESLTRAEAKKHYGHVCKHLDFIHKKLLSDSQCSRRKVADWSEYTDHMIVIVKSLIHSSGIVNCPDIARRMTDWAHAGSPGGDDTGGAGISDALKAVLNHPQFPEQPHYAAQCVLRSGVCDPVTNEAVAKSAILGIHAYNSIAKVIQNAVDVCKISHADPRCQASCVAVAISISNMLQRLPRIMKKNGQYNCEEIAEEAFAYSSKCLLGTKYDSKELRQYLFPASLKDLKLDESGRERYTYKCLGAGFWALRQKDFRHTIQALVMEGGYADANCAVAGSLLGCKLGLRAIPQTWVDNILRRDWLDQLMEEYLRMLENSGCTYETSV